MGPTKMDGSMGQAQWEGLSDAAWNQAFYERDANGNCFTGAIYCRSRTRLRDISDGTSNTYLIGERNICPDHYTDGPPQRQPVLGQRLLRGYRRL